MKSRHNIEICYKVQIWRVSYSIVHRNNIYFWGSCRYIAIMCRKIAFFGLHAEILLTKNTWTPGPGVLCRVIVGVREEILVFFHEIFTSASDD